MFRTLACTTLLAATVAGPDLANASENAGPPTRFETERPRYAGGKVFLGDKKFPSWQKYAEHIDKTRPGHVCGMNPAQWDNVLQAKSVALVATP